VVQRWLGGVCAYQLLTSLRNDRDVKKGSYIPETLSRRYKDQSERETYNMERFTRWELKMQSKRENKIWNALQDDPVDSKMPASATLDESLDFHVSQIELIRQPWRLLSFSGKTEVETARPPSLCEGRSTEFRRLQLNSQVNKNTCKFHLCLSVLMLLRLT